MYGTSSVSLLKDLGWETLATREKDTNTLFYQLVNGTSPIHMTAILLIISKVNLITHSEILS